MQQRVNDESSWVDKSRASNGRIRRELEKKKVNYRQKEEEGEYIERAQCTGSRYEQDEDDRVDNESDDDSSGEKEME